MCVDGTTVVGSLAYRTELFDPATIERMIGDYLALLEGAVADPDRPVAELFSSGIRGSAPLPGPEPAFV